MEKEFLPYEIALELKELGFSERCLKSYYKGSSLLEGHGNVYDTPAPTFSQCFRWFREKYGYLSYIDMDNYSFYRFTIYKGKGISEAPYHTYEEAELSCLKKLIEIIKSKSE
jgi:predicted GNAT superfamily acetyltransferase